MKWALLVLWLAASPALADHLIMAAVYCHEADNPRLHWLVSLRIAPSWNAPPLLDWKLDPNTSRKVQSERVESQLDELLPDWRTHQFTIMRAMAGPCPHKRL